MPLVRLDISAILVQSRGMNDFKVIKDYPRYYVNKKGQVKGPSGRILKYWLNSNGYPAIALCKKSQARNHLVHRLVANLFVPNPNSKPHVNHIDGNKLNNRADNLEWVTRSENMKHAAKIGLLNQCRKLTADQVKAIRASKDTQQRIAYRFGVSQSVVSEIRSRLTYKDV